jgi:hypothetical protein
MANFLTERIDSVAVGDWPGIQKQAAMYRRARITVERYSEAKEWTEQQRRWWKGVLLPALAEDSGESKAYWESYLKLSVMPDAFPIETSIINGREFKSLPSVNTLSCKKMNELIEGSVAECHNRGFAWVTLPDRELRKV